MALQILKEFPTGVTVEYWRIEKVSWMKLGDKISIDVFGYVNEDARLAGKRAVTIKIIASTFDLEQNFNLEGAYNIIKQDAYFVGGVDC